MKVQFYITTFLDDPTHFRRDDTHPVVRCNIEVCLFLKESFFVSWAEIITIRLKNASFEVCGPTLEYEYVFCFV